MANHLSRGNKLSAPRKERFSGKFQDDLETLVSLVAVDICQRHIKVYVHVFLIHSRHV